VSGTVVVVAISCFGGAARRADVNSFFIATQEAYGATQEENENGNHDNIRRNRCLFRLPVLVTLGWSTHEVNNSQNGLNVQS